jgi:hypothetical protein
MSKRGETELHLVKDKSTGSFNTFNKGGEERPLILLFSIRRRDEMKRGLRYPDEGWMYYVSKIVGSRDFRALR